MAVDPVCNMKVDEKNAEYTSEHNGKTYYFCAYGCKQAFDKAPDKFIKRSKPHHGMHNGCCC